jgi:hypothetical protein
MTFSIRTFLIAIAVVSVWLGALVSKSPLLIELAASATVLLILLTLPLAIWDHRPLLRAFWTGCFVLGFGNLLYCSFFSAYQQTSNQMAGLIMGDQPQPSYRAAPYGYPTTRPLISPPSSQVSFYAAEESEADSAPTLESPTNDVPANPTAPDPPPPFAQGTTYIPASTLPPNSYPIQMPSYAAPQPYNGNYYEQREAIRSAFPSLMSLLVGCLGGCVTMWIAARRKEASE